MPAPPDNAPKLGVYCETLGGDVLGDADVRRLLGEFGVTLGHAVRFTEEDDFNPDKIESFIELGLKLKAAGAGYALWPLLPKTLGYWINERNVDATERLFDAVLEGCRRAGAFPDLFIMDVETPWQQMEKMFLPGPSLASRMFSFARFLSSNRRPRRFAAAVGRLAEIVQRVRSEAAPVAAAVFPFLIADLARGGHALQDYLEMPVFPVGFDALNAMFYNSYIPAAAPFLIPPDSAARALFEYVSVLRNAFGEKAWVTLGSTWEGVLPGNEGKIYARAEDLAPDIGAAKAAGAGAIWLYCIEGVLFSDQKLMQKRPYLEAASFFRTILETPSKEPPPSARWRRSRAVLEFAIRDRLTSFYKWPGIKNPT